MSCQKMSDKDVEEAFKMFDTSGDGTISAKELGAVFKQLGQQHSEDEIKAMLKTCDKDASGNLSLDEFKALMAAESCDDKECRQAFNAFDKDGSGYITKDELKQAMKSMGEKLSDSDIDKMIAAADTDKDGKVGFEEFKKMMSGQ